MFFSGQEIVDGVELGTVANVTTSVINLRGNAKDSLINQVLRQSSRSLLLVIEYASVSACDGYVTGEHFERRRLSGSVHAKKAKTLMTKTRTAICMSVRGID